MMPLAGLTPRAVALLGLAVRERAAAELGGRVDAADEDEADTLPDVALTLVPARDIPGLAGVANDAGLLGDAVEMRPLVDGVADGLREEAAELVADVDETAEVREARLGLGTVRGAPADGLSGLVVRLAGARSPALGTVV